MTSRSTCFGNHGLNSTFPETTTTTPHLISEMQTVKNLHEGFSKQFYLPNIDPKSHISENFKIPFTKPQ